MAKDGKDQIFSFSPQMCFSIIGRRNTFCKTALSIAIIPSGYFIHAPPPIQFLKRLCLPFLNGSSSWYISKCVYAESLGTVCAFC